MIRQFYACYYVIKWDKQLYSTSDTTPTAKTSTSQGSGNVKWTQMRANKILSPCFKKIIKQLFPSVFIWCKEILGLSLSLSTLVFGKRWLDACSYHVQPHLIVVNNWIPFFKLALVVITTYWYLIWGVGINSHLEQKCSFATKDPFFARVKLVCSSEIH